MDKRLVDAVEEFLGNSDEVIVSVKKVWEILQIDESTKDIEIPPLTEFTKMLKNDARFEFLPPMDFADIYQDLGEERKKNRGLDFESIGFYSGERIKLRKIELTGGLLAGMIEKSVNRMMDALKNAWENKPDDKDAEKRLLKILKKAEQVKQELDKAVRKLKKE